MNEIQLLLSLQRRLRILEQRAIVRGDDRLNVVQSPAGAIITYRDQEECWAEIIASQVFTDEFGYTNYRHSWAEVDVSRVDGSVVSGQDGLRGGVFNLLEINKRQIPLLTGTRATVVRIRQVKNGSDYWWTEWC